MMSQKFQHGARLFKVWSAPCVVVENLNFGYREVNSLIVRLRVLRVDEEFIGMVKYVFRGKRIEIFFEIIQPIVQFVEKA